MCMCINNQQIWKNIECRSNHKHFNIHTHTHTNTALVHTEMHYFRWVNESTNVAHIFERIEYYVSFSSIKTEDLLGITFWIHYITHIVALKIGGLGCFKSERERESRLMCSITHARRSHCMFQLVNAESKIIGIQFIFRHRISRARWRARRNK